MKPQQIKNEINYPVSPTKSTGSNSKSGKGKKNNHRNNKKQRTKSKRTKLPTGLGRFRIACNRLTSTVHVDFQRRRNTPRSKTGGKQQDAETPRMIYTSGLHECALGVGGFPEFLVFNVPASQTDQVRQLLESLVASMEEGNFVQGGRIIESHGLIMRTKWVSCPDIRARLAERFGIPALSEGLLGMSPPNMARKWIALEPHFTEDTPIWGGRPAAPEGCTELRDTIVNTFTVTCSQVSDSNFTDQQHPAHLLFRYVDGNPSNCTTTNLVPVSLYEVFSHPKWCSNWPQFLHGSPEMYEYTSKHYKHFAVLFRPLSPDNSCDFEEEDEQKILTVEPREPQGIVTPEPSAGRKHAVVSRDPAPSPRPTEAASSVVPTEQPSRGPFNSPPFNTVSHGTRKPLRPKNPTTVLSRKPIKQQQEQQQYKTPPKGSNRRQKVAASPTDIENLSSQLLESHI